jgi:hypothetical protein
MYFLVKKIFTGSDIRVISHLRDTVCIAHVKLIHIVHMFSFTVTVVILLKKGNERS